MHWVSLWVDLTHPQSCPDSLQPELKACAVQLFPVNADLLMGKYEPQGSHYSVVD
ncbi:MAG: hypothetical protein MET45_22455 [Nostoc sp. LLA-1]|nr:hypothetical protein [Cyanocohniella sp. LLY]